MKPELADIPTDLEEALVQTLEQNACKEIPVPDRFRFRTEQQGREFVLRPRAFVGGPWIYGRIVRVDAGTKMQVLNCVLWPRETGVGEVFACQILAFEKGLHLLVLDACPLGSGEEPGCQSLSRLRESWGDSFPFHPLPEWGDGAFGPHAILLKRPDWDSLCTELVPACLRLLRSLGEVETEQTLEVAKREQYIRSHATGEPSRKYLQRLAGEEWTDEFFAQFFFPEWLVRDQSPPWADLSLMGLLKLCTRQAHDAIESSRGAISLTEGSFSTQQLRRWWSALNTIWLSLEQVFSERSVDVWEESMKKSHLLQEDLRQMGKALEIPPEAEGLAEKIREASVEQQIGILYVMEGSTLGGRILQRKIAENSVLDFPLRYLSPYGGQEGAHWKEFVSRMNDCRLPAAPTIAAADSFFQSLQKVLDESMKVTTSA